MSTHKYPARFTNWIAVSLCTATFALAGCTEIATYSEVKVKCPANAAKIQVAMDEQQHEPLAALDNYLETMQASSRALQKNPKDATALRDYNFALSRVFEVIRKSNLDPWTKPLRVPAAGGDFVITTPPPAHPEWNLALYDLIPADQIKLGGSYVKDRVTKDGIGAPLVAIGKDKRKDYQKTFSTERVYYGVTAVARFEGRKCVISAYDPLAVETTTFSGNTYQLAADYTAPTAVLLAKEKPNKLGFARLLHAQKYAYTARIARLQPYDPNKTVVLVVHGLMDTPATWTPMINSLRGDPVIRRNYQFWFYSYPSGYPYPYSAAIMREQLDAIEKVYPPRKPMVLIGHSMGGCVSRLMVTDSGDKLWDGIFGKPPEQTNLSPQNKKLFEESLIFTHRKEVGRVIFISTPHRGSDLASDWIGRLGSSIVRSPLTIAGLGRDTVKNTMNMSVFHPDDLKMQRIPNSVDTLAPNNRFVKLINTIPITPGIPYHTIAGDRGRGDSPNSSDGVVPYWSSHLDGAQSECIVPSNHGAHQNPKAFKEVDRILRLNAKAN